MVEQEAEMTKFFWPLLASLAVTGKAARFTIDSPAYGSEWWQDLPKKLRSYYRILGFTETIWEDDLIPEKKSWLELKESQTDALEVLGWTQDLWQSTNASFRTFTENKPWHVLTKEERKAARYFGFDEETWHAHDWGRDFDPQVLHNVSIPALEIFDFDFLSKIEVQVKVVDGATVECDEYLEPNYMTMKEYIDALHKGSHLYLKYEDHEGFKKYIRSTIGTNILHHLQETVSELDLLKPEWQSIKLDDKNWVIWVGGAHTTTAMHFDTDDFNFLWVLKGRKRIVLMPNDERTAGKYDCKTYIENHSCWTGVDILNGTLPDHAVEVELGPMDGIWIPHLCWHAVENLEPTIAFGLQFQAEFEEFEDDEECPADGDCPAS